jgi:hypothetical protein
MIVGRALVLAAALSAAACGAPLLKLPTGPAAPASDGAETLASATAACSRVTNISVEAAVSGSVAGQRIRGRLLVGVVAPSSFYIEAPAPFGAPVFTLGVVDGDATLLLPRDRRVLEHGNPRDILEAVAGVPLDAADLRTTLTACPSADVLAGAAARAFGADWRELTTPERRVYLRRASQTATWQLVSMASQHPDGWRTDFDEFVDGLPRRVRLLRLSDSQQFDLRLVFSQVDARATLDPQTFRIAVPPGTQAITIDDLRAGGPLTR